ncbi:MAG: hypothetical protein R8G66_30385 [Cytophagales bacterium]|nr:hypothetical protein [Cytophagales bacterium]MDW3196725.1 hypothetical protein [Cytophagales bacterium]
MDENKNGRIRHGGEISIAERHKMIQEYLAGGVTKKEIWYKYTGKPEEHGAILKWMRMYGYIDDEPKRRPIFSQPINYMTMGGPEDLDKSEMLARIKQLEKQLEDSKLREEGYRSMIELAERTFKIPIRKKSDTK